MQFIFQNIFDHDQRPRVLIRPSPGWTPSVTMFRLDDITYEWSHSRLFNEAEKMDQVLDAYGDLIKKRWHERTPTYTLASPICAAPV